jgi:hypothetical protein
MNGYEPNVEWGEWGTLVRITEGKYKGQIGEYDDEDDEEAVVISEGYPLYVNRSSMRRLTNNEELLWHRGFSV